MLQGLLVGPPAYRFCPPMYWGQPLLCKMPYTSPLWQLPLDTCWHFPVAHHTPMVPCGTPPLTNSAHSSNVQACGLASLDHHCHMFSLLPLGLGNKLLGFSGALATPSPKFFTQ